MSHLVDLIKEDFGIEGGGRWYRSVVHSSLVLDADNDVFYFNSRGISGDAVTYLKEVRGLSSKSANELIKNASAPMPTDSDGNSLQVKFEKLVDLFHGAGKYDREYWYSRKLTDATIDRYRLGNYDGWNLIPIYNNGLFYNFQCRRDKPKKFIKFWYKDVDFNPVLFNREILPFVNTVYITEGMVDCLLLNQLGFPAVCTTNGASSWNPNWIKYFDKIDDIVYIADNDSAGIHSAYRTAISIGLYKVRILRFKEKAVKYGALDWFRDGHSVEEFKSIIEEQSVYGFEKGMI